jgi:hypothetical protein
MKHLMVILALTLSVSCMAADEVKVAKPVLESFNASFKNANEVNWTVVEDHYKVNFMLNGQYISAFYNAEGHMLALTRNISTQQLPLVLQMALKNQYEKYWITDLFEVNNESGIYYYVTLENGGTRHVMKAGTDTVWTSFMKSSK